MAKLKLSQEQKIDLGTDMMNAIGEEIRLPWERYPHRNDPPPGYEEWSDEAREEWWNEQALEAGEAALKWLQAYRGGSKDWSPGA